jgi:hypothetical protein
MESGKSQIKTQIQNLNCIQFITREPSIRKFKALLQDVLNDVCEPDSDEDVDLCHDGIVPKMNTEKFNTTIVDRNEIETQTHLTNDGAASLNEFLSPMLVFEYKDENDMVLKLESFSVSVFQDQGMEGHAFRPAVVESDYHARIEAQQDSALDELRAWRSQLQQILK